MIAIFCISQLGAICDSPRCTFSFLSFLWGRVERFSFLVDFFPFHHCLIPCPFISSRLTGLVDGVFSSSHSTSFKILIQKWIVLPHWSLSLWCTYCLHTPPIIFASSWVLTISFIPPPSLFSLQFSFLSIPIHTWTTHSVGTMYVSPCFRSLRACFATVYASFPYHFVAFSHMNQAPGFTLVHFLSTFFFSLLPFFSQIWWSSIGPWSLFVNFSSSSSPCFRRRCDQHDCNQWYLCWVLSQRSCYWFLCLIALFQSGISGPFVWCHTWLYGLSELRVLLPWWLITT